MSSEKLRSYSLTKHGWSCPDCGALVINTPVHDAWHLANEREGNRNE